jgi:hypothetical protein
VRCSGVRVRVAQNLPGGYPCHSLSSIEFGLSRETLVRLNNPMKRGESRRCECALKCATIRVRSSFTVPSSERKTAPAISCSSPLLFEVREPLNGSLGSRSALCRRHSVAFSSHLHQQNYTSFYFVLLFLLLLLLFKMSFTYNFMNLRVFVLTLLSSCFTFLLLYLLCFTF